MNRRNIEYRYTCGGGPELVLCRKETREYPWHFHARHWTFGLVRTGCVTVTTLQGAFPLICGQTFAIAPLAPHKLSIPGHGSLAVLCLEEPGNAVDKRISSLAPPREGHAIPGDLAAWLAAPAAGPSLTVQRPVPEESPPIAATRRLLADRPDEHLPLETLANVAGYSLWYFLRSFKRETGLTPHAFQLICRLSRARAMLRSGTAAAEAAVSAGFTDQSHLHKLFRRHHGLTPGQFTEASVTLGHESM